MAEQLASLNVDNKYSPVMDVIDQIQMGNVNVTAKKTISYADIKDYRIVAITIARSAAELYRWFGWAEMSLELIQQAGAQIIDNYQGLAEATFRYDGANYEITATATGAGWANNSYGLLIGLK